ncbi:hypothetical protein [Actinoplanes sp. NPDC023714]|uniref:hypothetical protein n=1 Tax=Actinoplanes sp. NPDC023714 TaxID=3154322 RepID=UPI00340C078E
MRLSDLLEEARADAPPMRLDVDQLVRAGKRRHRRRNAGWAIAAVAAVAAAIGVPQILTRQSAQPPVLPATSPSVAEKPEYFAFTPTFRGYDVDGFRVEDPVAMSFGWTAASIREPGVADSVGAVRVYPPGVEPGFPEEAEKTAADPVGGHQAYYLVREDNGEKRLLWTVEDGSTVEVSASIGMSRAELRRVANGFRMGGGVPLRTALSASYLPPDYRMIMANDFAVRFVPAKKAAEIMNLPDRSYPPGVVKNIVSISVEPKNPGTEAKAKPACLEEGPVCLVLVAGGKYSLVVSGQGIDLAEVRRVFESVTVADPEDPAAWKAVDEAFPRSTRVAAHW